MLIKLINYNTGLSLKKNASENANLHITNMCLIWLTQAKIQKLRSYGFMYIKSKRQDNIGSVGPLNFQGETHTDPLAKANIFANYFSSVFTNEDTSCIPTMESEPLPCVDSIQIHVEGVAELLSNIDPNKANGPDNLPARFKP